MSSVSWTTVPTPTLSLQRRRTKKKPAAGSGGLEHSNSLSAGVLAAELGAALQHAEHALADLRVRNGLVREDLAEVPLQRRTDRRRVLALGEVGHAGERVTAAARDVLGERGAVG